MFEPLDDKNLLETLLAFADGELDAARSAAVLDYLVAHPQWLTVIRDHQRLRLEAHRVVHANTPTMSDTLRARIAELGKQSIEPSVEASPSAAGSEGEPDAAIAALSIASARRPIWWPVAAAAAVALVIGAMAGSALFSRKVDVATVNQPAPSNTVAIPPTLIAAVTKVHVDCSRFASGHNSAFPTAAQMGALADDVRKSFKTEVPYPDLRSIGYDFVGAGPCNKPLDDTVHLLYRATSPKKRDTLSIFVQPYRRQVEIPTNRFTLATIANAPHPSYVWRTDVAVYYLITDDAETADRARDTLIAFVR